MLHLVQRLHTLVPLLRFPRSGYGHHAPDGNLKSTREVGKYSCVSAIVGIVIAKVTSERLSLRRIRGSSHSDASETILQILLWDLRHLKADLTTDTLEGPWESLSKITPSFPIGFIHRGQEFSNAQTSEKSSLPSGDPCIDLT